MAGKQPHAFLMVAKRAPFNFTGDGMAMDSFDRFQTDCWLLFGDPGGETRERRLVVDIWIGDE